MKEHEPKNDWALSLVIAGLWTIFAGTTEGNVSFREELTALQLSQTSVVSERFRERQELSLRLVAAGVSLTVVGVGLSKLSR